MKANVVAGIGDPGPFEAWPSSPSPGSPIPATTSATLLAALAVGRAFCVLFFSGVALLEVAVLWAFIDRAKRAVWLHRWCRFACGVLGLNLTTKGPIPTSGLLVSNHLSYLDIICLSALTPCLFVAKRDVRTWPLFGWLAWAAGTIFVDRNRRSSAADGVQQIQRALSGGLLVVVFPEGTSSGGRRVLPFKSSLLEAGVRSRVQITAAAIDYSLPNGSVADEVCYWRDMTLIPHMLNLFRKRAIGAEIRFAPVKIRSADRKLLASELRAEVLALRV